MWKCESNLLFYRIPRLIYTSIMSLYQRLDKLIDSQKYCLEGTSGWTIQSSLLQECICQISCGCLTKCWKSLKDGNLTTLPAEEKFSRMSKLIPIFSTLGEAWGTTLPLNPACKVYSQLGPTPAGNFHFHRVRVSPWAGKFPLINEKQGQREKMRLTSFFVTFYDEIFLHHKRTLFNFCSSNCIMFSQLFVKQYLSILCVLF